MKTQSTLWQWLFLALLFPFLQSCDDDEDPAWAGGYIPQTISLQVDFLNKRGDDLVSPLSTVRVPQGAGNDADKDVVTLAPATYLLEVYLDGKLVDSSQHQQWVICQVSDSPLNEGYKTLLLYSTEVEKQIMASKQYWHSHVIEYHFTCQALFNDDQKHVVRYDFMPPSPETSVFDYQGAVSLDGQALQVFYPNGPIYAGQPQHAQGLGLAVETVIA